jgi:hypothetical protein
MNLIESYCKAVADTGKEITINIQEKLTDTLFDRVKAVAIQYDIACHAHTSGILLKPKVATYEKTL